MKPQIKIKEFINNINNPTSHDLRPFKSIVVEIKKQESFIKRKSDDELQEISNELKSQLRNGIEPNLLLVDAYSLVKEVCNRKLGLNPFDVQLTGAVALHKNRIVEMQTGEGKTLTAVFPAYLNALSGKGVHILTFNDYLAKRDSLWMAPVYNFLGLSVGFITQKMSKQQKRDAYNCDITYATAKEVGFDYLRSMIAYEKDDNVLRPFNYAIVDEADAVLIDEARNPLVLAGNIIDSNLDFYQVADFAQTLESQKDYDTDEYSRNIFLTETGIEKAEKKFSVQNLMDDENLGIHSAINLALQAKELLKKDIDYIIRENSIKLIDEFTGRIVEDRKWRNGLQTAVEAKEKIKINSEGTVLNLITLQHLIQKYPKIAGMTATAHQSAEEFEYFYKIATVVIPPNKNCIRKDLPDRLFDTKKEKQKVLLEKVRKVHQTGQPILIGTLTVKESEELAVIFKNNQIHCEVLNAKNDELEAAIIADAGKISAVTISTNMAGRGTDILLGGKEGISRNKIIELGGLYVFGTNKHESSRIDNQLKGRAGRQGDIGISEFFISMEDDLMVRYKLKDSIPKRIKKLTNNQLKNKLLLNTINHIQRVIEGQMFDIRRTLFDYSSIIEKQRVILQNEREKLLYQLDFVMPHIISIFRHEKSSRF
ncbi:MAG: accessory Sec system translocase SecA2 [Mariniphaga sp.]|nr:accessory Sec system translocase SecA2 [Mariniphaga sp.]